MDLLTTLEAEWHPKNEKPFSAYTRGSHFRALWKCSICEHEWNSTVANRVCKESKCPECRKVKARGNNNPRWNGYGEISGRHWYCIQKEALDILFEISIESAWELFLIQDRKCALTGNVLTMHGKVNGKLIGTAALDRKDSSLGYVEGNVQWVHKELQHTKRNLADTEFIRICQEVAAYQTKKNLSALAIPSFEEWSQKHL